MLVSVEQMALMSQLLDEALELDVPGRRRWLDSLAADHRQLEQALWDALLSSGNASQDLFTLPKLDEATCVREPGERIGPYRLVRQLGVGGMAEVWLAQRADGTFRREVALKVPKACWRRSELASRLARECDILAALEHPNIPRLYDAGETADGLRYLAMEYVAGEPLIHWCDRRRLGLHDRLELFLQVLGAVQYAHRRRVLHRDIKPSNILVTDSGEARLLDFGAGKLLEPEEARTELTRIYGQPLTPEYASPELLRGDGANPSTDVYALGIVLYELLAGGRPYEVEPGAAARWRERAIPATGVQRPSTCLGPYAGPARAMTQDELARRLRGDLDSIVLRALAPEAAHRYDSVTALGHDLRRYLRGEPVQARPDRLSYRAAKFAQRHKKMLALVAVMSLLLVTAIGHVLTQRSGAGPVEAPADSRSEWS